MPNLDASYYYYVGTVTIEKIIPFRITQYILYKISLILTRRFKLLFYSELFSNNSQQIDYYTVYGIAV